MKMINDSLLYPTPVLGTSLLGGGGVQAMTQAHGGDCGDLGPSVYCGEGVLSSTGVDGQMVIVGKGASCEHYKLGHRAKWALETQER